MTIFLDMDGVVSDAHTAFLSAFGREDLMKDYPPGEFHIGRILGVDEEEFWRVIDGQGRKLWSEMGELPWARHLYSELQKHGEVVFLSSPSWDSECVAGKLEWLQRFTGTRGFRDFIFTPRKELLAGPDGVLVDDSPKNCQAFRAAGGHVVTFPAVWQGWSLEEIQEQVPDVIDTVRRHVRTSRG